MYPTRISAAVGAVLAATAVLASAPPAGAGAPTRIAAEYWGVSCVGDLGDGLTFFLFGSGTTDGAEGGVGAFVEDAEGGIVAEGSADEFAFGDTVTARIPLGEATFSISADAVAGPGVTEVVNEHDGNRWTKGTTTRTEVALTPTSASYGGAPVALDGAACSGDVNAFDVRTTNPTATVLKDQDFESEICDVDGLDDARVRVSGVLPDAYVEVVLDHGGTDVEKIQGDVRLRGGGGTLAADVVDVYTGEVRTSATVSLDLARSGRPVREVAAEGTFTETRTVTPYREAVHVALADGRSGTATCSGIAVTTMVRIQPER